MSNPTPDPSSSNQDKLADLAQPSPTPAPHQSSSGAPPWEGKAPEPAPYYGSAPLAPPPYFPPSEVGGALYSSSVAPRNGKGIAALVCGILGLAPFPVTGFWLSLIAIVLGWQGYKRTQRGEATNEGVALTGFVLGIIGMGIQFLISLAIAFS